MHFNSFAKMSGTAPKLKPDKVFRMYCMMGPVLQCPSIKVLAKSVPDFLVICTVSDIASKSIGVEQL